MTIQFEVGNTYETVAIIGESFSVKVIARTEDTLQDERGIVYEIGIDPRTDREYIYPDIVGDYVPIIIARGFQDA